MFDVALAELKLERSEGREDVVWYRVTQEQLYNHAILLLLFFLLPPTRRKGLPKSIPIAVMDFPVLLHF